MLDKKQRIAMLEKDGPNSQSEQCELLSTTQDFYTHALAEAHARAAEKAADILLRSKNSSVS